MKGSKAAGFEFGIACDPGRKRKNEPNQDAVDLILPGPTDKFPPLLVVADGMGGYRGGAIASKLIVDSIRRIYLQTDSSPRDISFLSECIQKAHRAIQDRGSKDKNLSGMGTTVVAAIITKDHISVINVGDSRAYLLRGKEIIQLSQDQSIVADQVRAGQLTREEAKNHPKRSRLSMSISAKRPVVKPFTHETRIEADDIFVLCSDGLWSAIPETLIWAAAKELTPQEAADKLVALANTSQGPDNISVIIARRVNPNRKPASIDMEDTNPGE